MLVSYGLIAGLTLDEINCASPGFLIDCYVYRMRYDDVQHGIKRKSKTTGSEI